MWLPRFLTQQSIEGKKLKFFILIQWTLYAFKAGVASKCLFEILLQEEVLQETETDHYVTPGKWKRTCIPWDKQLSNESKQWWFTHWERLSFRSTHRQRLFFPWNSDLKPWLCVGKVCGSSAHCQACKGSHLVSSGNWSGNQSHVFVNRCIWMKREERRAGENGRASTSCCGRMTTHQHVQAPLSQFCTLVSILWGACPQVDYRLI